MPPMDNEGKTEELKSQKQIVHNNEYAHKKCEKCMPRRIDTNKKKGIKTFFTTK